MRKTQFLGSAVLALVGLAGCSSSSSSGSSPMDDGSADGTVVGEAGGGAEASDEGGQGGEAGGGDGGLVARGEYLVSHVAACGDCHTPRLPTGAPDTSKLLAGSPGLFQVPGLGPDGGVGIVSPRNLTPDMTTGIGGWTDAQIKNAILNGVDDQSKALFPIMPYFVFHNMTSSDADAIVAYLRTIPAVSQMIPEKNFTFTQAAMPVPATSLPDPNLPTTDTNYQSAVRGKYLAANVGICMECHTSHVNGPVPLDVTKLFAGGDDFPSAAFGLPVPPYPAVIFSENITQDSTGIMGWAATDVVNVLKNGVDKNGVKLCPPMPFGPNGAFGGLTDGDALDIANYITHLPAIANTVSPICHQVLNAEGGAPEGGTPEGGSSEGGSDASTDGGTDGPTDGGAG